MPDAVAPTSFAVIAADTADPHEAAFDGYRPFPNESGRNWRQQYLEIPLMIRALDLPLGGRILEVGCGRGVALPILAQRLRPTRLVGLDVDPELLEIAEAATAAGIEAELVEGDVRRLPFEDATFDLVIDFGTSFHIDRPGRALREIARVLTPGGLFAVETRLSQRLSHPVRSRHRFLPWPVVPELVAERRSVLWESRRRRLVR